jgi:hypothetical protein
MYSTFLTASSGSVFFNRSNLLKRKDLCFSCLRLGLIRNRRSLRSLHLFSSELTRFRRVTTRKADILVNISIGIQTVLNFYLRVAISDFRSEIKIADAIVDKDDTKLSQRRAVTLDIELEQRFQSDAQVNRRARGSWCSLSNE